MGKYLDRFKRGVAKTDRKVNELSNRPPRKPYNQHIDGREENFKEDRIEDFDKDFKDDFNENIDDRNHDDYERYDDMSIQKAQRPASFYHFILENQYQDLERSIRGFKDVFDKETQQWRTIRKKEHCFTDEEAEDILRTAQSHLATDIKLGYVNKDSFPILMDTIYQELAFIFESIAEYRYGRYGEYEKQYDMKLQNHKIFLELFSRIQANYSRSIAGQENKYTHDSVKGQESLQQGDQDMMGNRRYS